MLAHGTNPGLIGKSLLEFKDVDGKPITRDALAVKDIGWINFKWQNPLTKAVEPKVAYIVRVGEYAGGWRVQMMSVPASSGAIQG